MDLDKPTHPSTPIAGPTPTWHMRREKMNTKDAVRVVWHHENVKAALEIYNDARKASHEAYKSVDPGEEEFVLITLNGNKHYMIHVDVDGDGAHKVRRLAATTPGDGTRPAGYSEVDFSEFRQTNSAPLT